MSIEDEFLFHWAMIFHEREFQISVRHDGTIEWLELAAVCQAGGDMHVGDFIGGLMGDHKAAARAHHRISEYLIHSPGDETAMALLKHAAEQGDELPWPIGLEDALDAFFSEQFWEHVNPQLPDPLPAHEGRIL